MTESTYERRLQQLITDIMQHPNSQEIIKLAEEQLLDDTFVLATPFS